MSDPREVGLPPIVSSPTFAATSDALHSARRRHGRRRQRRTAVASCLVLVLGGAVFAGVGSPGADSLIAERTADQPAPAPAPGDSATPGATTPTAAPSVSAASGAGGQVPGANQAPGVDEPPVIASAGATKPNLGAPARTAGPPEAREPSAAPRPAANSGPVTRTETARGQETCRQPLSGWSTQGWCMTIALPDRFEGGAAVTLAISLCRVGGEPATARFRSSQQAAWVLYQDGKRLWASSEQPSRFSAGESVTLSPGRCLTWQVRWRVSSGGQALRPGRYTLDLTTGADVRDARGEGYHDQELVDVR